jgi:hypothetical protein
MLTYYIDILCPINTLKIIEKCFYLKKRGRYIFLCIITIVRKHMCLSRQKTMHPPAQQACCWLFIVCELVCVLVCELVRSLVYLQFENDKSFHLLPIHFPHFSFMPREYFVGCMVCICFF